ncbi:MAG: T9SS type A sorting domain-containing protein [Bacteroidaceae bacterium]|nr:T9SS type A sorting domain-containing protein [Bacteroidaceae bacterium]
MKRIASLVFLSLLTAVVAAKSLVITLNDRKGTQVFYKLSTDNPPRMVMEADGTFTLNSREYAFSDVKCFRISQEDYSGEKNTEDGIIAVTDDEVLMQGDLRIYSVDGRLLGTAASRADLKSLARGTYIISNGRQTLKIRKQ